MAETHGVQAVIGLTGFEATVGGARVIRDRLIRLDLPQNFTRYDIQLVQEDLKILSDMADRHPEKLLALQNAVLKHDYGAARRLASEIGLNEEEFVARGGGGIAVIIAIAIAAALLLESDSPPPPPPPQPDGGAPDAGPG